MLITSDNMPRSINIEEANPAYLKMHIIARFNATEDQSQIFLPKLLRQSPPPKTTGVIENN